MFLSVAQLMTSSNKSLIYPASGAAIERISMFAGQAFTVLPMGYTNQKRNSMQCYRADSMPVSRYLKLFGIGGKQTSLAVMRDRAFMDQ